ncbi:hypothetical protein B4135_0473 [Caldibacillus debilis]|uniref:Uncharacterized protein n=1 Tax=Caldibacillus debilis TaxID=301148 RepID=A0A150L8Y9_9BACI|nr:hypothetical protein B4135_0473 [Caldibacillus debilis]
MLQRKGALSRKPSGKGLIFNGKLFGSRLGSADGRKANIQLLTSLFVKKRKANT